MYIIYLLFCLYLCMYILYIYIRIYIYIQSINIHRLFNNQIRRVAACCTLGSLGSLGSWWLWLTCICHWWGSYFCQETKKTRWSPRTRMLTRMLMVQMSKHMVMQSRTIPFCNSLFEQSCACFPCYQSAVWSGKCRVWSVECEVRSVECKVWSGECRVCKV